MTSSLMTPTATQTATLIANLWQRSQPLILQRLQLLDNTALAAATQSLTEALREEAARTAHNLAGSLGMFGYHQGTTVARHIEFLLDSESPAPDCEELTRLIQALRRSLEHQS